MSFALGVLAVLLSFPIIFVISVVISLFTKIEESFWDRVWITVVFIYFVIQSLHNFDYYTCWVFSHRLFRQDILSLNCRKLLR